ncbi:MAG: endonuclease/exonuclease/phosphatase family protein [Myxococcales bacterium]|nr:endonuclease/exonuclease/phosphatase family protein [Myxococcales bacterium]
MRFVVLVVVVVLLGCEGPVQPPDAGSAVDAGADAGDQRDAGASDASVDVDAGALDAGDQDAGTPGDAGSSDAGLMDAGTPDAGFDAGAPDAGPRDAGFDAGVWPDGGIRVRVIAANLTSGNLQTYDPGHGQRILQALGGDIVAIQELNAGDNSNASISSFVEDTFTPGFFFHRGSGRIPNGIISRFPIVDAGEWNDTRTTDREFTWAVIDAPGPVDVWVVSLHLLSNTPANRNQQAIELLQYVNANVPPNTHLVLAGDLNTDGRNETVVATLSASVVTAGPWPTDGTLPDGGNGHTSTNRSRPYDWVLVSPSLHALGVPLLLEGQYFPSGLVFDTRVFAPLPFPALVDDSIGPNMQHMAVVRDFVMLQ